MILELQSISLKCEGKDLKGILGLLFHNEGVSIWNEQPDKVLQLYMCLHVLDSYIDRKDLEKWAKCRTRSGIHLAQDGWVGLKGLFP